MIQHIDELLLGATQTPPCRLAVAAAADEDVIRSVVMARRAGIAEGVLTGDAEKIRELLTAEGEDPEAYTILPAEDGTDCAKKAVEAIRKGEADFLMKGLLSTADMMRAVIDKESGIRTHKLISHVMLYEVDSYPKMMALTDGGMNTFPDLEKKAQILENAAGLLHSLGYERINAACICGAEAVNPKIQSTVDAKALSEMTERFGPLGLNVFGPVGLDLAISPPSCVHKGYSVPGAGEADILLVPSYEVGNGIGKAMTYFANGRSAGVILGAKVPIVLVSRADPAETKLASIALGKLAVKAL